MFINLQAPSAVSLKATVILKSYVQARAPFAPLMSLSPRVVAVMTITPAQQTMHAMELATALVIHALAGR
jgi:hypothetical protein